MLVELFRQSETHQTRHVAALAWRSRLTVPNALVWLTAESAVSSLWAGEAGVFLSPPVKSPERDRMAERRSDTLAAQLAVSRLFAEDGFPVEAAETELLFRRDALGKPFVEWQGDVAAWAAQKGLESRCMHISNTHDGDANIVFAAYAEGLVGVGIDAVYLPRLRGASKDAAYLQRFAQQFMGPEEVADFLAACADESEEAIRLRVAAHFSLMEAASKACGTGLKIGAGMGKPTSLPKRSLGVYDLNPPTRLRFEEAAEARLAALGATHSEAYWDADADYLLSLVLLWKRDG